MQKFIPEFNKHLNDPDIFILKVEGDSLLFTIQNENYRVSLTFKVKNKDFMNSIGRHCMALKSYKFSKKDIKQAYIENNDKTLISLQNRMLKIMNKVGFDIEQKVNKEYLYFKKLPRIIHKSKYSDRVSMSEVAYKNISTTHFLQICTPLIFASNDIIESNFMNWYNRLTAVNSKWYSQQEKDEMDKISKDLSYAKQKEYTPY